MSEKFKSSEQMLLKRLEDTKNLWKPSGMRVAQFEALEYAELRKLRDLFEVYLRTKLGEERDDGREVS